MKKRLFIPLCLIFIFTVAGAGISESKATGDLASVKVGNLLVAEAKQIKADTKKTKLKNSSAKVVDDALKDINSNEIIYPEYTIGGGDVLMLSVWKDEALSRQVTVLPDGTISLPLVGQVVATGRSIGQLEQEIKKHLETYVPDPVLDVSIVEVNSMVIYVLGNVSNPNLYKLTSYVDVLQALTLAGGLGDFADADDIKIYRKNGKENNIIKFNYNEVIKGKKLEQNIQLKRDDVIVVP